MNRYFLLVIFNTNSCIPQKGTFLGEFPEECESARCVSLRDTTAHPPVYGDLIIPERLNRLVLEATKVVNVAAGLVSLNGGTEEVEK